MNAQEAEILRNVEMDKLRNIEIDHPEYTLAQLEAEMKERYTMIMYYNQFTKQGDLFD